MMAAQPASPAQAELLDRLLAAGHLIASGVPGVYGRGEAFEAIRRAFEAHVARAADAERPERPRFPPVLPRVLLERTRHFATFPHLSGTIFAFEGGEQDARAQRERAERHEDYSEFQTMTELAMVPAACYPVYPAVAARGLVPSGGLTFDLGGSYVFRREPSDDPTRLQVFHQGEMVRIGEPEAVVAWRDAWREQAFQLLRALGLDARPAIASDAFFGRAGRVMADAQRDKELKFEILASLGDRESIAVASFNYHRDHFACVYGISMEGGGVAHSACVGFGHERIVIALLHAHGMEPADWPSHVRAQLWPS